MAASAYAENLALNFLFRGVASSPPSAWYIALFNGSTEVSGTSYARQAITFLAPIAGIVRNGADISFGVADPDWGLITEYAVYDALTSGNLLVSGSVAVPVTPDGVNTLIIEAGEIEIVLG